MNRGFVYGSWNFSAEPHNFCYVFLKINTATRIFTAVSQLFRVYDNFAARFRVFSRVMVTSNLFRRELTQFGRCDVRMRVNL